MITGTNPRPTGQWSRSIREPTNESHSFFIVALCLIVISIRRIRDDLHTLSDAFGTEIESYLTQYLLVVLCADIQQEIYRLSEERASVAEDTALSSYVSSTAHKVLRSVRKDEIATFVGMFGVESKKKLNSLKWSNK